MCVTFRVGYVGENNVESAKNPKWVFFFFFRGNDMKPLDWPHLNEHHGRVFVLLSVTQTFQRPTDITGFRDQ